jgi:hypothetical protein
MKPDEFIDWLQTMERIFNFKKFLEYKKVKLVALKLKKYASLWWENQRAHEGKTKIRYWQKMKGELKMRFLPKYYRLRLFSSFIN